MMPPRPADPIRVIVMGVSGCGKSTVASALAQHLGLEMIDGDDLHLPQSIRKMGAGIPLNDADRWPWLDRIARTLAAPGGRVVACSALKRAYRDRIREQVADLRFVFLDGSFDLISRRLSQRVGHYMQPGLLQSQFDTLERPRDDETDIFTLAIDRTVAQLVQAAARFLLPHAAVP